MSSSILFIFEGEKTEVQIYESLKRSFSKYDQATHIYATFNADVYELYRQLKEDEFLDLIEIIRGKTDKNKALLQGVYRDDVSEIYLFFDYDGHATKASNEDCKKLLSHFNEETENGKLYISYPMVEALKHLKQDVCFKETVAVIEDGSGYKKRVSENCDNEFLHLNKLTAEVWNKIITAHSWKLNFIVNGEYSFPERYISQEEIFDSQLQKYIDPKGEVAVLSAFPVVILDYYGVEQVRVGIRDV